MRAAPGRAAFRIGVSRTEIAALDFGFQNLLCRGSFKSPMTCNPDDFHLAESARITAIGYRVADRSRGAYL